MNAAQVVGARRTAWGQSSDSSRSNAGMPKPGPWWVVDQRVQAIAAGTVAAGTGDGQDSGMSSDLFERDGA
jgi:hypothetical protein